MTDDTTVRTRKIQEVGGGTFTVSLPKDWARAAALGQGDTVELHAHLDGVLVVQPRGNDPDSIGEVTIELRNPDPAHVRQSLQAAYTAGYTEVTLTTPASFGAPERRVAEEVATVLAGLTVTTTTREEITCRVLLDPDEVSVSQLVRQLSFVATSMQQAAMAAVADGRTEREFADRDDQADRLFALTERSFVRALSRLGEVDALGAPRPQLFELWTAARNLERVADHAERIGAIAREFDEAPDGAHVAALRSLSEQACDIVDGAVGAIVDGDGPESIREVLALRSAVREETVELDRRLFGDAAADYRLARVLDGVRRTAEHGGNIAERGLRRSIRREPGGSPEGDEAGTDRPDVAGVDPSPDGR